MLDIIICHKNREYTRARNLKYVLNYYKKNINIPVKFYVVEQDTNTDLTEYEYVNHIKFNTSHEFSKSKGYNLGFKKSNSDYLMLLDSDIIVEQYILNNLKSYLNKNKLIIPYDLPVIMLSNNDTIEYIKTSMLNAGEPRKFMNVGGVNIVSREMYFNVGGFDPDFIGWGFEDSAFIHKIQTLYSIERVSGKIYHLFHNRLRKNLESSTFKFNKEQYKKIKSFNIEELKTYIRSLGTEHLK